MTDSTRAPDLTYYLRIDLKHKAGQGCATKYMRVLGQRITILKDYINKLICNGVICPGLTGTAVKSLARNWVKQGVSFYTYIKCFCVFMCVRVCVRE